jgi:hypothetical protein
VGIMGVLPSIPCDPYAVEMRSFGRLPSAESHFCVGAAPQVGHRTARICFGLSSFVTQTSTQKGRQLDQFREAQMDGLRPPDNGHRSILQKGADECAIYLQAAVVADEAFLLERIHEFAYPCAGCTNHFRERCLAHLQGVLWL